MHIRATPGRTIRTRAPPLPLLLARAPLALALLELLLLPLLPALPPLPPVDNDDAINFRRRESSEAPMPSAVCASSNGVRDGGRRSDKYLDKVIERRHA